MRRKLFTLCSGVSLLVCAAAGVLWGAQAALNRPLVTRIGDGRGAVARFVAVEAGSVVLVSQWVVYVEEGDPSLGPQGLDGGAYFGTGKKPDVSEYNRLRNDAGQVVFQSRSPGREWLPSYRRHEPGALVDGDYAFKTGADGRQSRVRYGWWFRSWRLAVPAWILMAVGAPLPAAWIARRLRRGRRVAANRCPECGYDLRASQGRCPECGSPPARAGTTA